MGEPNDNDTAAAAAGAQDNDEEETAEIADQPLDDEVAATTPAESSDAVNLLENSPTVDPSAAASDQPLNDEPVAATADEPASKNVNLPESPPSDDPLGTEDIAKEEIATGPEESAEIIPDEKKMETGTAINEPPLISTNDVLLNFGETDVLCRSFGSNAEETNQQNTPSDNVNQEATSSNGVDLVGFGCAPAEAAKHALDTGAVALVDNPSTGKADESTAGIEPVNDLLGMSSEENRGDTTQQPSPELANPIDVEPHSSLEKEEKDMGESTGIDSPDESVLVSADASAENLERASSNEGGSTQSESENASAPEQAPAVDEVVVPDIDSQKGNESAIDTAGIEILESPEISVNSKGEKVNQTEDEDAIIASNEDNQVEEKQSDGSSELKSGQGIPQEEETDCGESISQEPVPPSATMVTMPSSEIISQHVVDKGEKENSEADENAPSATVVTMPAPESHSQHGFENGEKVQTEADENAASEVEERTEEEEEWLSMGLGLGDALRQIVTLTEEKDSALMMCQEKEDGKVQAEALFVEFQSRLQDEMGQRAEYESELRQARETLKSYEERLEAYAKMEDDLEQAQVDLVTAVSQKSKIELEVQKLREIRDHSEQKEVVLSNRLNDAKKKEANKITAAGRLEADNENLRDDLKKTKDELETTTKAKTKLESNMEKLKVKAVERVKQAETALAEERELNEERKKKMKAFVESKAEGLREAKDSATDMQQELEETRASLRSSRDREEASQKEVDAARLKYRELQRDMDRMKRNSEQLHRMGNNLEQELEKSATESEEHKKKRMSAKHEIMQMVRTLEAERGVSSKLRESVKFTFTPKALSQQELLTECLRDFELELEKLAAKTGKGLLPSPESSEQSEDAPLSRADSTGSSKKLRRRGNKSDMDTERLISNLEQETQGVSKGIMALSGSIERMRSLLDDDNMFGCMTYLSNIIAGTGEARHQRLDGSEAHEENTNAQFV